jgi:hypothetical protein
MFVFYNLKAAHSWTYPDLPQGWRWLGSGRVSPIGASSEEHGNYAREEQFGGPAQFRQEVEEYLRAVFDSLQEHGIVGGFKVEDAYTP